MRSKIDPLRLVLERAVADLDGDRARAFLQQLDPDSQEGLWFEAFAESFPSRLDAALAYTRERGGR